MNNNAKILIALALFSNSLRASMPAATGTYKLAVTADKSLDELMQLLASLPSLTPEQEAHKKKADDERAAQRTIAAENFKAKVLANPIGLFASMHMLHQDKLTQHLAEHGIQASDIAGYTNTCEGLPPVIGFKLKNGKKHMIQGDAWWNLNANPAWKPMVLIEAPEQETATAAAACATSNK